MAVVNFTGLVSGLDTKALVASLMQIERRPLQLLQDKQSRLRKVGDALREINTALSSLRDKLQALKTLDSDPTKAAAQITDFVNAFNAVLDKIATHTAYNPQTRQAGVLLGESLVQGIPDRLFRLATSPVPSLTGSIRSLADIGIVVGAPVNGQVRLQVDQAKLTAALQNNRPDVQALFANADGLVASLSGYIDSLIGPGGILVNRVSGIDQQVADLGRRITDMEERLTRRQQFLEKQFTQMELALQRLQQQQGSLGGLAAQLLGSTMLR